MPARRSVLRLAGSAALLAGGAACDRTGSSPTRQEPVGQESAGTVRTDVPFRASGGLRSTYHLYPVGSDDGPGSTAPGLLVWLHGDEAWEYHHRTDPAVLGGPEGVVDRSRAAGFAVACVLTPDRDEPVTWWEEGAEDADFLAELIEHVVAELEIDEERIVLAGYSGGAQQITQYFLPAYSSMLTGGGAILFGGGGVPETEDARPWNRDLSGHYFLHWATGQDDDAEHSDEGFDALGEAADGFAYYSERGFATSREIIPGRDHDLEGLFGRVVAEQLQLFEQHRGS